MSKSSVPGRNEVKRKQTMVLAAIVILALVVSVWALSSSFSPKGVARKKTEKPITTNVQAPAPAKPRDIWIAKSEEDILRLDRQNKTLEKKLEEFERKFKEANKAKSMAGMPNASLPKPYASASGNSASNMLPTPPGMKRNSVRADVSASGINLPPILPSRKLSRSQTGLDGKQANPAIKEWVVVMPEEVDEEPKLTVDNYLPAGSVLKIRLLAGIDAPTGGAAQSDPIPFLAKIKDDGSLPNGFKSHVKACHIVAAGYGDISSERLYGRTEKLSCVLKNGQVLEKTIDGYLSGEDGKAGMRGRLVSKQGALIARALLAGVAGGIGQGISDSYQTVTTSALGSVSTVDPNKILEEGLASGVGSSLDRISKWYLQRADETYPVIEVDAARYGDIILKNGVALDIDIKADVPSIGRRTVATKTELKKAATLEKMR